MCCQHYVATFHRVQLPLPIESQLLHAAHALLKLGHVNRQSYLKAVVTPALSGDVVAATEIYFAKTQKICSDVSFFVNIRTNFIYKIRNIE